MKTALLPLILITASVRAAGIDQAVTEQLDPSSYRITFDASPETGSSSTREPPEVAIYASSRPDRIDTIKPLLEKATSPATVTAASSRRVYFHLKPKVGPVRVTSIRVLPLEGGMNFRDLGGYRTTDGKHVRWGLLYRSAKIDHLTARDFAYLGELDLKLVCDFRMPCERTAALGKWPGPNAPEIFSDPVDTLDGPRRSREAAAARHDAAGQAGGLPDTYRWMATDGLVGFRVLLRRIAGGDTPVLFHCQEGRGRTGVFAALLLMTLGVPRETIMKDFLLTNEQLTDQALRLMVGPHVPVPNIEGLRRNYVVAPEYLEASFAAIDERFATLDAFVRDGLNLTDAELEALRSRLLEP